MWKEKLEVLEVPEKEGGTHWGRIKGRVDLTGLMPSKCPTPCLTHGGR